jgi:hypothetical protein
MNYNQFLQKLQKATKGEASQDELNELWAYQSENEVELSADELDLIKPAIPIRSKTVHLQMIGRGLRKQSNGSSNVEVISVISLPKLESISDSNFENCEKL